MSGFHEVLTGQRVALGLLGPRDRADFLAMVRTSRSLHHPWTHPPDDEGGFAALLQRGEQDDFVSLLGRRSDDGSITGVVNFSQIFYGPFRSAYCGFYANAANAGVGLMRETLSLAVAHGFGTLRLHRIEANVQPANERSLALVRRVGFRHEGFSPRYLFVAGAWRDHERFAVTAEEWPERA